MVYDARNYLFDIRDGINGLIWDERVWPAC